jgi:hypothetical protein
MKAFAIFLFATALLPLTASTAFAGDNSYMGKIVAGPEWTTMEDETRVPLPKDHPNYTPNSIVRFKTASDLGKRILRTCPNGSRCWIRLSIVERPKDYRVDGRFITVIKWPYDGVEKD